jgi:hypothetical protein
VCLELPNHLPALADNADCSIAAAEKEAVRAGAYTGYLVAVEEIPGFVIGETDLGDFEEVE